MANARRDAAAIKRGGGRIAIPLDEIEVDDQLELDRAGAISADLIYDRRWAFTLLDQVFARLREESQNSANPPLQDQLSTLLSDEPERRRRRKLHASLVYRDAVKQALHRLRRRYRQLLREEIAQTVATPADIEDEMRCLIAALRS